MIGPDHRLAGIELRAGNTATVGLFDTGAEICAVDQQFVDKHKKLFTPVKSKGKASEVGGKQFSHKMYMIKALDLGEGLVSRNVYAIAYDFGVLREALGRQTPFILGYNFVSATKLGIGFRISRFSDMECDGRNRAPIGSRASSLLSDNGLIQRLQEPRTGWPRKMAVARQ